MACSVDMDSLYIGGLEAQSNGDQHSQQVRIHSSFRNHDYVYVLSKAGNKLTTVSIDGSADDPKTDCEAF